MDDLGVPPFMETPYRDEKDWKEKNEKKIYILLEIWRSIYIHLPHYILVYTGVPGFSLQTLGGPIGINQHGDLTQPACEEYKHHFLTTAGVFLIADQKKQNLLPS